MPQLSMQDDFDIARAGQPYDNNMAAWDIVSVIVDPAAPGFAGGTPLFEVTAGAEDPQGHRAIASPSGVGKFLGIAVHGTCAQALGYGPSTPGATTIYGPRSVVPVMRSGRIWCNLFGGAVTKGTSLSAGTAGNLGSLTGGAGTNIPVQAYMKSVTGNTLVVAEIALPVPNTADAAAVDADG